MGSNAARVLSAGPKQLSANIFKGLQSVPFQLQLFFNDGHKLRFLQKFKTFGVEGSLVADSMETKLVEFFVGEL